MKKSIITFTVVTLLLTPTIALAISEQVYKLAFKKVLEKKIKNRK